jgi:hypothetical protein
MKYRLLGACLLGAALLVGCGAQPGSSVITYESINSAPPPTAKAPDKATYKLYPSDSGTPLYTADLDEGDPIGFVTDSDGKVVAIAGTQKIPLTAHLATSYVWKEEGK